MARSCQIEGCRTAVPDPLKHEGLCLTHFSELVLQRTDEVRAGFLHGTPVNQSEIDWLLGDAAHVVQALAGSQSASRESVLEMLLCLANLQDYITHHSVHVKNSR